MIVVHSKNKLLKSRIFSESARRYQAMNGKIKDNKGFVKKEYSCDKKLRSSLPNIKVKTNIHKIAYGLTYCFISGVYGCGNANFVINNNGNMLDRGKLILPNTY